VKLLSQQPIDVVLLDHDLGAERASQFQRRRGRSAIWAACWQSPPGSAIPRPADSYGRA
jgi:hypothetical protein